MIFLMSHCRPLLRFWVFADSDTIIEEAGIRTHDLSFVSESPSLTTRPGQKDCCSASLQHLHFNVQIITN